MRSVLLSLLVCAALTARAWNLGATGFSEDEISKVEALEAYRRWDFTANAEHPMLMKLAALASMQAAEALNASALDGAGLSISREAALRFPNALAGALTTACIFLLAEALFGAGVAWWAALLWAFDVNAIAISRIGKEDSLLVFFLLLAAWCYERGKQAAPAAGAYSEAGQRWFARAGAAFGLMAATKYMPYYFGLHVIYCRAADPNPGLNRPDKPRYLGAMLAAFVIANFAVLLTQNWAYLLQYSTEQLLHHTGYVFAGKLYVNQMSATPFGLPSYFYLAYLVTKVPLVVLVAALVGLVSMVQWPRDRGIVFLRVFLVLVLLPYSLIASKFVRYVLPLLAVIDMIAAVGVWRLMTAGVRFRLKAEATLPAKAGSYRMALSALVLAAPVVATLGAAPHYALYHNVFSAAIAGDHLLFPHCELYDAGVREAARLVAERAAPGAVILSEAPRVVTEYVGPIRPDVRSRTLTEDAAAHSQSEVWVLVQDGRIYFENLAQVAQLRATHHADAEVQVGGVTAVQVFRLPAAPVALHSSR